MDVKQHRLQLPKDCLQRIAILDEAQRISAAYCDNIAIQMLLHHVMQRLPSPANNLPIQPSNSPVLQTAPAAGRPYLSELPRQCTVLVFAASLLNVTLHFHRLTQRRVSWKFAGKNTRGAHLRDHAQVCELLKEEGRCWGGRRKQDAEVDSD
jgi:hypothetical protein